MRFNKLKPCSLDRVVDKFLDEVREKLSQHDCHLEVSEEAKIWLRDRGYEEQYGARSLRRLVQSKVKDGISDILLFEGQKPGVFSVFLKENDISIQAKNVLH